MKKRRKILFALCYLSYTAIYIARLNLSIASPALKSAEILSAQQYGILGGAFSVVYAAGRLLNGILSDRRQPWSMISAGLLAAGISNVFFSFFPPFAGLFLLWCANAFAQSMLWSSVLCTISVLYDPQEAREKNSVMVTSVATGNILGILINLYLIEHCGLRWAFILPGALTLLLGAISLCSLRPVQVPFSENADMHESIFQLLRSRETRTILLPAVSHGIIKDNVTLWMAVFFVDSFAIDLEQSSYFILLIPIIGFLGRASYPLFFRHCGQHEHRVSLGAFAVCAVCASVLCLRGITPMIAMFCLSLIYAAVSLANTSFLSVYPTRYAQSGNMASVSGLMDFSAYLGAGAASFLYGQVVDRFGYSPMFASWTVLSVISGGILFQLLKKTDP
ncbi:MFS transporter [uncultured Dysosmobacter sp.]|uniref:MFS transporter n=1 Tax=uncultured Dysosmobacter sp. TaxID=2591384 RepID=UPI00261FD2E0|nr:MFS transporter [uncultured Dysosmobacter sp.]